MLTCVECRHCGNQFVRQFEIYDAAERVVGAIAVCALPEGGVFRAAVRANGQEWIAWARSLTPEQLQQITPSEAEQHPDFLVLMGATHASIEGAAQEATQMFEIRARPWMEQRFGKEIDW